MSNPWLSIPLADYEGHMASPVVRQLQPLAEVFGRLLRQYRPESVAVLGIAGGNGLEHVDSGVTTRVVGIDIHPGYLEEVSRRFGGLAGLELHCADLAAATLDLTPVALVHTALIFEHTGLGQAVENAVSLVGSGGWLSVVLQLPSPEQPPVGSTEHPSMQALRSGFALVDLPEFRRRVEQKGFRLVEEAQYAVASGKALWLGVFSR
jgi:hypothetical protein